MRNLLTMLACAAVAGGAVAQQPAKRAAGLDVVPADGFAFVSVSVSKLWDEEQFKELRDALLKLDGSAEFEKGLGFAPADLDRLTLLWPQFPVGFGSEDPILVVTTRKPHSTEKLLKALGAETFEELARRRKQERQPFPTFPKGGGVPKELAPPPAKQELPVPTAIRRQGGRPVPAVDGEALLGEPYFLGRMGRVLLPLDASTVVFLPFVEQNPTPLLAYLARALRKQGTGPLAEALAVADKHTAVAGLDFRPVRRDLNREKEFPREFAPFRALTNMDGGFATLDLNASSVLAAALRFPTADDAAKAEPVLKTAIRLAVDELAQEKKWNTREAVPAAVLVPLYDAIIGSLDKATVKQSEKQVVATATLTVGPPLEKALKGLPAFIKYQNEEIQTQNNLKQIGLGLHNYHDAIGHFPQDIVDKAGKPILSWRVQILPYIDEETLYKQLDLTKPWDDPANAKVLAKMPKVFEVPGRAGKDGETYFQMFWAEKPVEGGNPVLVRGVKLTVTSIADGTSNTLGVVEAGNGVNWAKPGDLPFDPKKLPPLGDPKTGKFRVVMMDGSVRTMRRDKLTDDQIRALVTVSGGEVFAIGDEK